MHYHLTEAQANPLSCMMKTNNNRAGFTAVEIMVVVSAVLVVCYIAGPAVKSVGSGVYSWFTTPTPTAATKACEQAVATTNSVLNHAVGALTGK